MVWPPQRAFHRSFNELPPPPAGVVASKASLWRPSSIAALCEQSPINKVLAPQKRTYQWPPSNFIPQGRKTVSSQGFDGQNGGAYERKKSLEFDDVVETGGLGVHGCYRPPPWCQFYMKGSRSELTQIESGLNGFNIDSSYTNL